MSFFLQINRIVESSRILCNASNLGITYLEFLILVSTTRESRTKKEIAELLLKDKSYISKKIDSLYQRKFLKKNNLTPNYEITQRGRDLFYKLLDLKECLITDDSNGTLIDREAIDSLKLLEKFELSIYGAIKDYEEN